MAATASFPAVPKLGLVQIVNADASAQKTVLTAGASGAKVTSVFALSDDTSARLLTLSVLRGGTNYPVCAVSVPAEAGTGGVVAGIDLLQEALSPFVPRDNDGQRHLLLEAGDVLQIKSGSTVTVAKTVTVGAMGANF